MSGFQITNRPTVNSANQQPLSQADQSHNLLKEYQAHITTKRGATKSGVMFISTSGNERLIKRDGAFSIRSRNAAEFSEATTEIKNHFRQAYQYKVSPQLFDQLMNKLDTYTQNRNNTMGTKSFTKFVTAFEAAAAHHETQVSTGAQALGGDVARKLRGFHDTDPALVARPLLPGAFNLTPKKQSRLEGVAASFGTDQVRLLGNGTASDAFAVSHGGKVSVVTVPFSGGEEVRMDGRHKGEMAAALARVELPHVAKPIAMVIRVGQPVVADLSHRHSETHNVSLGGERGAVFFNEESYLVPTDRIEAFLAVQKSEANLSITAVQMPAGSGMDLSKVTAQAPLSDTEFGKLAAGMYMGLNEMHSAGLAHRDIKPGNLMFDRAAGEVMLIDLGSTQALDANGQTVVTAGESATSGMSELFTHPALVLANQPTLALGKQTDRYAFGLTLMTSLAPDLAKLNPAQEFKKAFNSAQQASPHPISGNEWLDALITSLDAQAMPPDVTGLSEEKSNALLTRANLAAQVRDQLNVAFANSFDAKDLVQKVLSSAIPGPSGDEAWNALALDFDEGGEAVVSDATSDRFGQREDKDSASQVNMGATLNVNLGGEDEEFIAAQSPKFDGSNNVPLDQRFAASEVDGADPYDLAGIRSLRNSIV